MTTGNFLFGESVEPMTPLAPYIGGKKNLSDEIIARIIQIPHSTYAEPFVGMGGVFFWRDFKPKKEIINDLNDIVINLFRVVRDNFEDLCKELEWKLYSRSEYKMETAKDPADISDVERAAWFLYLQRSSFAGKGVGSSWGGATSGPRFNRYSLEKEIKKMHRRLARVCIECLDYAEFIKRYDESDVLFYLDPPYLGTENYYSATSKSGIPFFEEIVQVLSRIKGRFILSINDVPEIRDIFKQFKVEEVKHRWLTGSTACELIISN